MPTSFEQQAATSKDPGFIDRVVACGVRNALTFVNDTRPEFVHYSKAIIASEANARQLVWPTAGRPDITVDTNDVDLNSAVQSVYPLVGASYVPAT